MTFLELLRKTRDEALARSADPWSLRLERVRGKTGYDGVERISTQDLFDILEVPQRARSAGACRRLAALMGELGWTPMEGSRLKSRLASKIKFAGMLERPEHSLINHITLTSVTR
jgi:hypothetical protein